MSARSNLVNFSQKKNMTSNSSKPIGLLPKHLNLVSDDRLPNAYALPDFQPILSTFFDHHSSSSSLPGRKGVDTGENRAHTSCWPFRIIYNDQATRYLIYSHFQSSFDKDEKIARKRTSNHCVPRGVLTQKNSLVSKELYRKVFNLTEANFDLDTSLGPGL